VSEKRGGISFESDMGVPRLLNIHDRY